MNEERINNGQISSQSYCLSKKFLAQKNEKRPRDYASPRRRMMMWESY